MTSLLSRLAMIAPFLFFVTATQAQDQVQDPVGPLSGPLAGVEVMQLSVAPLSLESARCGLQADLMRDSFQEPLATDGIAIQKAAHVRVIMKASSVLYQETICISNIEAAVVQTTRYLDRRTQTERAGQVLLWSQSRLFVSGQPDHVVVTNIGVRELARDFLRKWRIDQ